MNIHISKILTSLIDFNPDVGFFFFCQQDLELIITSILALLTGGWMGRLPRIQEEMPSGQGGHNT